MPLAEATTTGGPATSLAPDMVVRSSTPASASRSRVRPAAAAAPMPRKWRLEIDTLKSSARFELKKTTPTTHRWPLLAAKLLACRFTAVGTDRELVDETWVVDQIAEEICPVFLQRQANSSKADSGQR